MEIKNHKNETAIQLTAILIVVMYLVFYWKSILIDGKFPLNPDTFRYTYPWLAAGKRLLLDGFYFLWDPYRNMGQPFLALPQNQALYPLRFLSVFLNFIDYQRIFLVSHCLLAASFSFLLGRKLGADVIKSLIPALGMGFNGFFLGRVGYDAHFATMAWIPCILFFLLSKQCVPLGIAFALQWFAGYPAFVIQSGIVAVVFAVVSNDVFPVLRCLIKGGVIAAGLACVQLLPFLEALHETIRPVFLTSSEATAISAAPLAMVQQLTIPAPWLNRLLIASHIHTFFLFYLGPLFLILFCIGFWMGGKRERALGIFSILFLLLSFGDHFPFYKYVPLINIFRYPANWLMLFQVCGLFVALHGITKIPSRRVCFLIVGLFAFDLLNYSRYEFFGYGDLTAWTQVPIRLKALDGDFENKRIFHAIDDPTKLMELAKRTIEGWTIAKAIMVPSYGVTMGFREVLSPDSMIGKRASAYATRLLHSPPASPLFDYAGIGTFVVMDKSAIPNGSVNWKDFDVITNPDPKPRAFLRDSQQKINVLKDKPGQFVAQLHGPGLLVFSEAFFPGWKVDIDGQRRPTAIFEDTFLAAQVESGSHVVRFRYLPDSFVVGCCISAFTLLFLIIQFFWFKGRRAIDRGLKTF